jgi:hypothetical protein
VWFISPSSRVPHPAPGRPRHGSGSLVDAPPRRRESGRRLYGTHSFAISHARHPRVLVDRRYPVGARRASGAGIRLSLPSKCA